MEIEEMTADQMHYSYQAKMQRADIKFTRIGDVRTLLGMYYALNDIETKFNRSMGWQ